MNGLGPSRRQVKAAGLTRSDRVTSVDEPAGHVVGRFSVQSSSTSCCPLHVEATGIRLPGPTVHQNICGGLAEIHWISRQRPTIQGLKQFGVEIIGRALRAMNCPYRATDSSGQNNSESLYEEPTYRFVANRHPPLVSAECRRAVSSLHSG